MKRLLLVFTILLGSIALMAQTPTISSLVVTHVADATVKWYTASTGGTALASNTALVNGTIYYASQTIGGVESTTRFVVTANLTVVPTAATHSSTETSIAWNWNASANVTGYKWNTTNNYATSTNLGNVLTVTQTGLTCNTGYTIYVWAYNATCNSGPVTLTKSTSACISFSVLSIDYANASGGTSGSLDGNDQIIITFSKEVNPSTLLSGLTKGGNLSFTNGDLDFWLKTDWSLSGRLTGNWYIGTFTSHGTVYTTGGGIPHFNSISLDAGGTVLRLNLINSSGNIFNNASSSNYVGYTPNSNIKAADGSSISVTEIREPDGSAVF